MRFAVGTIVDPGRLLDERWFASKERSVVGVTVEERFTVGAAGLAILRADLSGRRPVRYTLPVDDEPAMWTGLAELATRGGSIRGDAGGTLVGVPPAGPPALSANRMGPGGPAARDARVRPLGIDQSHTSVVLGEASVLKLYRHLEPGPNPEVELARALAAAPIPPFEGAIRYTPTTLAAGRPADIAVVQRFVPGATDEFERLEVALAGWLQAGAPSGGRQGLLADLAPAGRTIAALHAALLDLRGGALAARATRATDAVRWSARARRALSAAIRAMARIDPGLAADLRARRTAIQSALAPLTDIRPGTSVVRIHGDLHLGQLIRDGSGFLVVDLEGEPTRSVAERRRPDSPLRDVASMLRSFDHIARSAIRRAGANHREPRIEDWLVTARRTFLGAYLRELSSRGTAIHLEPRLLHAFEVEKELYEFAYAATYLPAWRYAPAAGLRWLLERGPDRTAGG